VFVQITAAAVVQFWTIDEETGTQHPHEHRL